MGRGQDQTVLSRSSGRLYVFVFMGRVFAASYSGGRGLSRRRREQKAKKLAAGGGLQRIMCMLATRCCAQHSAHPITAELRNLNRNDENMHQCWGFYVFSRVTISSTQSCVIFTVLLAPPSGDAIDEATED